MKLTSFTVEHYRSITNAKKIKLDRATVLVGPNNEGKSNLLRALVLGMNVLTRSRYLGRFGHSSRFIHKGYKYDWDLDFPLQLQEAKPKGESVIHLEFGLTSDELDQFKKEVGSTITGSLPIRIAIGQGQPSVKFHKGGPHSAQLSKKSDKIADFITKRLDFVYIPAIRTAESAEEVVNEMVSRELAQLEENSEYQKALSQLAKLQDPILKELSKSILQTFQQFLPKVKKVDVRIRSDERYRALRRAAEISVDDGINTLLAYKGDGAQSLAALAIIRHSSQRAALKKHLIIAIEEPESHLHPDAIHELKDVIYSISEKNQTIITTHNPLFVDRRNIGNNIIVKNTKAKIATNIDDLRSTLGVRASDNLRHAEIVLVVEGEDDKIAIQALLSNYSSLLDKALRSGALALDSLGGASNLNYKLSSLSSCLCLNHVFLDHDTAGKKAAEKAKAGGLITDADINFACVNGLVESEIEDLYDVQFYQHMILNAYRVNLETTKTKKNKKWSDRMKDQFFSNGKRWDDSICAEVKLKVANLVKVDPERALSVHKKQVFDNLVSALEARLKHK